MTPNPKQTKENSLYLPIKQVYFDAILDGSKDKEYRSISPNTVKKYIENQTVEGELQLFYDTNLISEDKLEEYANDYMYYNNGVFPYIPKDIKQLNLGVGYHKDRDTMTVKVTDISFEPGKDKEGNVAAISYDQDGKPYKDENGEFTMWQIVFHLGEVVEVNEQLKMDK